MPDLAGCERVVPGWHRLTSPSGVDQAFWGMTQGLQVAAEAGVFAIGAADALVLYRTDGTVITSWRQHRNPDPAAGDCLIDAIGIGGDAIAVAFDINPGRDVVTTDRIGVLTTTIDQVASTHDPAETLGTGVVGSNVVPWEVDFDGSRLSLLLYPGYVYVGRAEGTPWRTLDETTGDFSAEAGVFANAVFFYDAYPTTSGARRRARDVSGTAASSDFIARGPLIDVGGFRMNDSWAVWVERRFTAAGDMWPSSSAVVVASTHGVMDPSQWTPEDLAAPPAVNHINEQRPLLADDLFAYVRSPAELELIDLVQRRHVVLAPPSDGVHDYFWAPILVYLDHEYLYALVNEGEFPAPVGYELRRYSLTALDGWTSLH